MTLMRLRLAFAALAFIILIPLGSEAAACSYLPDDDPRSDAEIRADYARQWHVKLTERRARAEAALAAGTDPARPLAEMLVPNIVPVPILAYTSCGQLDEIDFGRGRETQDSWLEGTAYAGRVRDFPSVLHEYEGWTPGPACNAEFRDRFAAFLRRRLTQEQLRAGYLFLAARWEGTDGPQARRSRLMAFEPGMRRPPVRWNPASAYDEAAFWRWVAEHPDAQALRAAVDAFWRREGGRLGSMRRACPRTAAAWPAQQARIVAEIRALEAARLRAGR